MKIRRIELDGFGRLARYSVDLSEGLNLFFGSNEAGKSTLQQAILAVLYGFYESDRLRPTEREIHDYYEPWNGGPYRGRLEYTLSNGQHFRIVRDFSSTDVETHVHDLSAGGRDVTDEYGRGRHGNLSFATRHLGMPKDVFKACAFVSEGELFDVQKNATGVGDAIISLADSARRDISAQDAIDRLKKVYAEDVGSARARIKPLPSEQRRLEKLLDELVNIDAVRAQIAEDSAAREEAQARVLRLSDELLRNRYLLAVTRADEANQRLTQLNELTQQEEEARTFASEHEAYARFPVDERDDIQGEWVRIQEMATRLSDERTTVDQQRDRVRILAAEREGVAREQREVAHLHGFPQELRSEIQGLFADWRAARARADEAQKSLDGAGSNDEIEAEFDALDAEVGSLTQKEVQRLYDRLSERERGGAFVAISRFIGSILRLLSRIFSGGKIADESRPSAVSREEAQRLLTQRERWNTLRPQLERVRGARATLDSAKQALRSREDAFRNTLQGVIEDVNDIETAWQVFEERADAAGRLDGITRQIREVDREIESLSTAIGRFEQEERQLRARRSTLTTRLRELIGSGGSLEELLSDFDEGCRRRRAYDEATRDSVGVRERRGILLAGRSPDELRRYVTEHKNEAARILHEMPSLKGATTYESARELAESIDKVESELHAAELRIKELATRIETELGKLRSRAAVEEDIEVARHKIEQLERFRDELEIAIETISEAAEEAHRDFGPHVARFLSEYLGRVTSGRYCEAHLDPLTLDLRLEAPETRQLVEIDKVSRGTRGAAYLLLRIGLAQHMSSMHEPVPLILDDPLVDLDDTRLGQFLNLLPDLADEVQILLFTKSEGIKSWFQRNGEERTSNTIIELEGPP